MKLVTWNCSGGLLKKHEQLLTLGADIAVIQECSQTSIEQIAQSEREYSFWFIGNPQKGLAVLAKAPWAIRGSQTLSPKWSGKLTLQGPASIVPIELFPVWAHVDKQSTVEYIEQVHLLLDIIEQRSVSPFTIIAGDLNSNTKWDRDYGIKSHTAAVERLLELGLESAYHKTFACAQGTEQHPTFWLTKNKNRPYHTDYVFLSGSLLSKCKKVEVGGCDQWLSLSDHAPVFVELDV
jgi:exodeoxyribonuclease-3